MCTSLGIFPPTSQVTIASILLSQDARLLLDQGAQRAGALQRFTRAGEIEAAALHYDGKLHAALGLLQQFTRTRLIQAGEPTHEANSPAAQLFICRHQVDHEVIVDASESYHRRSRERG